MGSYDVSEPDILYICACFKKIKSMSFITTLRVFFQFQESVLFKYGWFKAWWKGVPIDRAGNPVPWITYPALDFISQFDFSDSNVFEWGSGFSTIWWSKRCRSITSVETNEPWILKLKGQLYPNATVILSKLDVDCELEFFSTSKVEYDIIVIDNNGSFRKNCALASVNKIKDGGMIILDNSDQCLEACRVLRDKGFQQIDFTGMAPGTGYAQTTSIFFKGQLGFKTLRSFQPAKSVAQPNEPWPMC
jgi:hypothetical protein